MEYEPGGPCHSGSGPGLCPLLSLGPIEGTGARGGQIGCVSETALGRRVDTAWVSGDHGATLGTTVEGAGVGARGRGQTEVRFVHVRLERLVGGWLRGSGAQN